MKMKKMLQYRWKVGFLGMCNCLSSLHKMLKKRKHWLSHLLCFSTVCLSSPITHAHGFCSFSLFQFWHFGNLTWLYCHKVCCALSLICLDISYIVFSAHFLLGGWWLMRNKTVCYSLIPKTQRRTSSIFLDFFYFFYILQGLYWYCEL